MKLGLAIIARNEEVDIQKCLKCFIPQVDMICLVDTGSTDRTIGVSEKILKESGKLYSIVKYAGASDPEGRILDFSAARNFCMEQVEKMGADYIWSVDADDVLTHAFHMRDMISLNPADVYSIRYRLSPDFWFVSHKVWKAGVGVKWEGRVHENLKMDWKKHKVLDLPFEVLHTATLHPNQESGTIRNMRILKTEIYPPLRSLFYWSNENVDIGLHEEAVKWYLEYIRRAKAGEGAWPVELAHCYFRAARWLVALERVEEGEALSKELLAWDPSWSEGWCELAHISKSRKDYKEMRRCATMALGNKFTPRLFSECDKYSSTPTSMLKWLDGNNL